MEKCRIGIIGENNLLTGAILNRLKSWRFPADVIQVYRNDEHECYDLDELVAENEILFICCDCEQRKALIKKAVDARCLVIDMVGDKEDEYPCIVPLINGDELCDDTRVVRLAQIEGLQLIQSLGQIHEVYTIEKVSVSTYQSLAKADYEACQELRKQMESYLQDEALESKFLPYQKALNHLPVLFNPLPQVDCFTKEGYACSEKRMEKELQQVFQIKAPVYATCVWIASMRGTSMSIQVKVKEKCTRDELVEVLSSGGSSLLIDDIEHQMYPIPSDVIHDYRCFIGRVRCFDEHTIGLWSVCDEMEMLSANGVMAAFIYVNNGWIRK